MKFNSLIKLSLAFLFQLAIISNAFAADVNFICGNHDIRHVANSIEEATELQTKFGCAKWDVRSASFRGMSVGLKNDYLKKLESALAIERAKPLAGC